jgi:hypothetical protein
MRSNLSIILRLAGLFLHPRTCQAVASQRRDLNSPSGLWTLRQPVASYEPGELLGIRASNGRCSRLFGIRRSILSAEIGRCQRIPN